MVSLCSCAQKDARCIYILLVIILLFFTSTEVSNFAHGQYAYYSYLTAQGIDYWAPETDKENITESEKIKRNEAQKQTSIVLSANNFATVGPGLVTTLVVGYISDRFGRRVALAILIWGGGLQLLSAAIIIFLNLTPWGLLVSNIIEGIFGGGLLSAIAQLSVCVVDLTSKEKLQQNSNDNEKAPISHLEGKRWFLLTLFDGLACISLAAASAIAGHLIQHYRFNITIITGIAIYLPSGILIFFLPETNLRAQSICCYKSSTENNVEVTQISNNILNKQSDELSWSKRWRVRVKTILKTLISSHLGLICVLIILFLVSIAAMVDGPFLSLYLMNIPFLWNAQKFGIVSGLTDGVAAVVSIILVVILTKFSKFDETELNPTTDGVNHGDDMFDVDNNDNEIHDDAHDRFSDGYKNKLNVTQGLNTNYVSKSKRSKNIRIMLPILLIFGLNFMFLSRLLMTIAYRFVLPTADIIVYISLIPRLAKSINIPVMRTMITEQTSMKRQGLILSFASFISRIGLLICVTVLPIIYSVTVSNFPGAVFLVCASALFLSSLLAIIVLFKTKRQIKEPIYGEENTEIS